MDISWYFTHGNEVDEVDHSQGESISGEISTWDGSPHPPWMVNKRMNCMGLVSISISGIGDGLQVALPR